MQYYYKGNFNLHPASVIAIFLHNIIVKLLDLAYKIVPIKNVNIKESGPSSESNVYILLMKVLFSFVVQNGIKIFQIKCQKTQKKVFFINCQKSKVSQDSYVHWQNVLFMV